MIFEFLSFPFFQRALVAGLLVALAGAVLGVFVVLRRMSFFSDAIAHSALAGIALGILFSFNPFWGAVAISVLVALGIAFFSARTSLSLDTLIGVFFSGMIALGVIIIGVIKGYQADLFQFLFGDILAVGRFDLWMIGILSPVIVIIILILQTRLLRATFHKDLAKIEGVPVELLNYIFLVLLALTVAVSIKAVGIILVSALIIIPAAAAKLASTSFRMMMVLSVLLGLLGVVLGLVSSFIFDTASGPTIALANVVLFIIVLLVTSLVRLRTA